jgi:hypothetical protein
MNLTFARMAFVVIAILLTAPSVDLAHPFVSSAMVAMSGRA